MLRLLVIGASKGIGLETVKTALAAGHRVRAYARSAEGIDPTDQNLERFSGDATRAGDVRAALNGIDAVVQALGVPVRDLLGPVRLFSDATNVLVPAMDTGRTCGDEDSLLHTLLLASSAEAGPQPSTLDGSVSSNQRIALE